MTSPCDDGSVTQADVLQILGSLQVDMAYVDLFTPSFRGERGLELTVLEKQNIRLKIDGNGNHARPHLHVDYGRLYHSASYALDNGERLAGNLQRKYDKAVTRWIDEHRDKLLHVWRGVRDGTNVDQAVSELKGSDFY